MSNLPPLRSTALARRVEDFLRLVDDESRALDDFECEFIASAIVCLGKGQYRLGHLTMDKLGQPLSLRVRNQLKVGVDRPTVLEYRNLLRVVAAGI
jgi:hypothetical protein